MFYAFLLQILIFSCQRNFIRTCSPSYVILTISKSENLILGDIKILSQSHSLHPLTNQMTSLHQLTNQSTGGQNMQSLPDLTDFSSSSRPGARSMMTTSRTQQPPAEMIQRMSPIQILFNDSGQYFVNFNMQHSQK